MSAIIQARDLVVELGAATVVDGVDVDLTPGRVLAILGPNGAGKSTLLEVLGGGIAPTAGTVRLDGRSLSHVAPRERARSVSFLRQSQRLPFSMTALDTVLLGRAPHFDGVERPEDVDIAAEALAATDTLHLASRRLRTLSGGERQRVHLARVLAQLWGDEAPSRAAECAGRVLLLDEPTAGLDLGHAQQLLGVCREQAARGVAVALVVHDLNQATRFADRVLVLSGGVVRAAGHPHDCLDAAIVASVFGAEVRTLRDPVDDTPFFVPTPLGPGQEPSISRPGAASTPPSGGGATS